MKPALLDVNALIALMWPAHEFHDAAQKWFKKSARRGWATCPFTEVAFVRIVSNPAFSRHAVKPVEALDLLSESLKHEHHQFWKDEVPFSRAAADFRSRLAGHRQVSDCYLLGLALYHKASLATFDDRLVSLAGQENMETVELITTT